MIQRVGLVSELALLVDRTAWVYGCEDGGRRRVYAPPAPYEDEVARRWWSLPLNCKLPLTDGRSYQLLFPGRPGSSAGPDVRDAILSSIAGEQHADPDRLEQNHSTRRKLVGDIEFHVRNSDWRTHRHDSDPRYNAVILHVVLIYDDPYPTTRQDGMSVPVCSLYDLSRPALHPSHPLFLTTSKRWPCQRIIPDLSPHQRDKLLMRAGLLRFEQKTHAFIEQLHAVSADDAHDLYNVRDEYDACLIPALAEAMGYGRDRAFFRAAGLHLLQKHATLPEPLGRTNQPAPLDAKRLHILAALFKRWRIPGAWHTLRACLLSTLPTTGDTTTESAATDATLTALRQIFTAAGLSPSRTDILIVNVVLPFAAAVALLEHHPLLSQRAHHLYIHHPGLPSNSITRAMTRQLQLPTEPHGSCRQQGLHYIYQQTCREKRCNVCLAGKHDI